MRNSSETQSQYNEENDQPLNRAVALVYLFIFLEALIHVFGNDFHDLGSSPFDPNSYLRWISVFELCLDKKLPSSCILLLAADPQANANELIGVLFWQSTPQESCKDSSALYGQEQISVS